MYGVAVAFRAVNDSIELSPTPIHHYDSGSGISGSSPPDLAVCVPPPDLSLLTRIPGLPYKEPAEIKVERDDSLDRDGKEFSKQSSGKNSSKGKRKHKV